MPTARPSGCAPPSATFSRGFRTRGVAGCSRRLTRTSRSFVLLSVARLPARGLSVRCVRLASGRARRFRQVWSKSPEDTPDALRIEHVNSPGPGNFAFVEVELGELTEVFTGFGERGVRAEVVAKRLAGEVRRFLDASVPVGEHLADQLLLPMALAGGGSFVTQPLSPHATTNVEVIRRFLPVSILVQPLSLKSVRVEVVTSAPTSTRSRTTSLRTKEGTLVQNPSGQHTACLSCGSDRDLTPSRLQQYPRPHA